MRGDGSGVRKTTGKIVTGNSRFCMKGYRYMKAYRTFVRWLACILLAAWSAGALKLYEVIPNAAGLGEELYDVIQYLFFGGNAIGWIVLMIAISAFYHWISKRITFSVRILIPALILVLAFVLGSFLEFRNLVETAGSYSIFVILASPGTLALFYSLLWEAFHVFQSIEDKSPAPAGRVIAFYERHPMPLTMGILLVCWLPYIILYCPGTIQYDGAMQLNMFFGQVPFTTPHYLDDGILYPIGTIFGIGFYWRFYFYLCTNPVFGCCHFPRCQDHDKVASATVRYVYSAGLFCFVFSLACIQQYVLKDHPVFGFFFAVSIGAHRILPK